MKKIHRFLLVFLLIILLGGLCYLQRTLLIKYLLEPIANVYRLVIRTISSTDQKALWMIMLILIATAFFTSFPKILENKPQPSFLKSDQADGAIDVWKKCIESAVEDPHAREALQMSLSEMAASAQNQFGVNQTSGISPPQFPTNSWWWITAKIKRLLKGKKSHYKTLDSELENALNQFFDEMDSFLEK